jgi:hypothetical protein
VPRAQALRGARCEQEQPTLGDVWIYNLTTLLEKGQYDHVPATVLDGLVLRNHAKSVAASPLFTDYLASGRKL